MSDENKMKNKLMVKSQFVQIIRYCDKAVVWHSLFGYPKIVSEDTLELLDIFSTPHSIGTFLDEYDIGENGEEVIHDLIESYYIVPKDFDERTFLAKITQEREQVIVEGGLIGKLELTMTEECNFRCAYCVHFGNLGMSDRIKNPNKFMTFRVAKEAVDLYIKILRRHGKSVAKINFGGGEPLLVWPIIEQILKYYRLKYISEFPCNFAIITNASLVTPEIAKNFMEYGVEVASSLDGLGEVNDSVRLTKSGGGTFDVIIRGLDNLAVFNCPVDIAVTINDSNFHFVDEKIIDWIASRNMKHMRITTDVINMVTTPVDEIVTWLMRMRRYGREHGVDVTGSWYRPIGNFNDSALDKLTAFCGALCGDSICVNPSGNIYGCSYSTNQLGRLQQIASFHDPGSQYQHLVQDHLVGRREACKGCIIEGQCIGGCEITREFSRASNTTKIEQVCDLYRRMTRELFLEQLSESV